MSPVIVKSWLLHIHSCLPWVQIRMKVCFVVIVFLLLFSQWGNPADKGHLTKTFDQSTVHSQAHQSLLLCFVYLFIFSITILLPATTRCHILTVFYFVNLYKIYIVAICTCALLVLILPSKKAS